MINTKVEDIRREFARQLTNREFVTDKTGVRCLEIINACFIADEPSIFGNINEDWNKRELEWYLSGSLNVNDIPNPIPQIWKQVATPDGFINSNYGWCVYSKKNNEQFKNCLNQLKADPNSRRATMIYTRPSMQYEYNFKGMSDFMCTYATQAMIRNNKLHLHVMMRSNDSLSGYKGDFAWQKYVHTHLYEELLGTYPDLELGNIYWNAISLHVYERHFYLVDYYAETGINDVKKEDYDYWIHGLETGKS